MAQRTPVGSVASVRVHGLHLVVAATLRLGWQGEAQDLYLIVLGCRACALEGRYWPMVVG